MTRDNRAWAAGVQTALRLVYPPLCLACGGPVSDEWGLCPACWRDTGFIGGLVCDACGVPLPGDDPGEPVLCDGCMAHPRPWAQGRAALFYEGTGRRLVLSLKHGDRHEIARPAGKWLAAAARPLLRPGAVVAPVPLHWRRLLRRRFNQSALLARAAAAELGCAHVPDLLQRARRTPVLDGLGREARFAALEGALRVAPRHLGRIAGRPVLLVDDVMTSGATLEEAARACRAAGAGEICVLALARVANRA